MQFFSEDSKNLRSLSAFAIEADLEWEGLDYPAEAAAIAAGNKANCKKPEAFDLFFETEAKPPLGLVCQFHGRPDGNKLASLRAILRRRPKSDPPQWIAESVQRSKGVKNGFRGFLAALGQQSAMCDVDVTFGLSKAKDLKIHARKPAAVGDFKCEEQRFSFAGKDGVKVGIVFREGTVSVAVRGKFMVKVDDSCFDMACETAWSYLRPILKSNE